MAAAIIVGTNGGLLSKTDVTFQNGFSAKIETDKLRDELEHIMDREMQIAVGEIIERTQSGKTPEGGAMKAYSAKYRKYKDNKGTKQNRNLSSRGGSVNLTLSGQLLEAINSLVRVQANTITGIIYFNAARSPGSITNSGLAQALEKLRPFFALSKKQIDQIVNALKK